MNIFVDLDNTLIYSKQTIHGSYKSKISVNIIIDGINYRVYIRPHIIEFLENLKNISDHLCILTYSSKKYATKILKTLGLNKFFDGLYSREDIHGGSQLNVKDFILIDDMPADSYLVRNKMEFLGLNNEDEFHQHLINVDPFYGGIDDSGLIKIMGFIIRS